MTASGPCSYTLRISSRVNIASIYQKYLRPSACCLADRGLSSNDRLTTAALSRWLQHERNSTDAAVPHLTRALPALGQVNGRMEGTPLLQWLCQRLRDPAGDVRSGVAEALGRIGEAVAQHPEVLSALVQAALHDTDELVRAQAAESFRRMGAAAAQHPE